MSSLKAAYAPIVSSPLNPESCYEIQTRSVRHIRIVRNAHRPAVPVSPTQRLLRQKAAAAWRSETLHHVIKNLDRKDEARIARIGLELRRYGHPSQRSGSRGEKPSTVDLESSLGLPPQSQLTLHKDSLPRCDEFRDFRVDLTAASGTITVLQSHERKPRHVICRAFLVICLISIFLLLPASRLRDVLRLSFIVS
jgi:hypothetical protein